MDRSPITRAPVTVALLAHLIDPRFPVGYGEVPVGPKGSPTPTPYLILDPAGERYIGGTFGDQHGVAEWGYQATVVSNATDAVEEVAGWVTAALFTRDEHGHYTPSLTIAGQREWDRSPDPQGFRPGVSAEGIVTLVQRFTIRTQRA